VIKTWSFPENIVSRPMLILHLYMGSRGVFPKDYSCIRRSRGPSGGGLSKTSLAKFFKELRHDLFRIGFV
jgi:hypothetical protein